MSGTLQTKISIFRGNNIRKVIYQNEWWFSVIDIIKALTGSSIPRRYWSDLKININKEGYGELYEKIVQLKLRSSDRKKYLTDCANTETMFRIIESIPSPKAEPIKRWLAKIGYERIQEIEDPELATKRTRALYKAKGYSEGWIEKRMRGIQIREELTNEWRNREVGGEREYAILTAEISQATFGMRPSNYKKFKGLKRQNLRDHMDGVELIFSMLGEVSTTHIARAKNTQGFNENKDAANKGGNVAGNARRELEEKSGRKVSTKQNYLKKSESELKLSNK